MLEDILSLAQKQAEQAEVYEVRSASTPVSFEANRLKSLETKESHGVALRLVRNGRVGLASATDLRDQRRLVDAALAVAEFGAEARFHLPARADLTDVPVYDQAASDLSIEEMVASGQGIIDAVLRHNPDILCDAGISKSTTEQRTLNSEGGDASYRKTVMSAGISGTLTRGTDILTIYEDTAWCQRLSNIDDLAQRLIHSFELSRETVGISTCACPVVFTPKGVASVFVMSLQLALNGKTVLQGASPLGQRRGEEVLDRRLSLWDDGRVPFAPASGPCDDEGVPTGRTPLIEAGVVRNFIYDLQTAGLAGARSTGNGFRPLGALPSPSYTSLIFSEGDATLEEMIADVKDGVLIDQVMGAWAGNVISGDFSGNIHLGFKIENGRLVGRVKDCMVAGNVFEALGHGIAALGRPAVWEGGTIKLPPLYFGSLPISARG
ncbi:MAG: TldD/PmbA family protein [Chloroflexi bacterium]|nr:TldD/PmbA family protein [Chloroflexota bacterium]